jgi:hypothetical protein
MSRSNIFASNLLCLSISIMFAELKQDSEGTVDTGTANISRVIMARVEYAVSFLFHHGESWFHSPVEHNKDNLSGELRRISLIACLYGRTLYNILYVEFQRISMSHGTLN